VSSVCTDLDLNPICGCKALLYVILVEAEQTLAFLYVILVEAEQTLAFKLFGLIGFTFLCDSRIRFCFVGIHCLQNVHT